jgi:acid phosphatase
MPYLNMLITNGGLATNYFADGHPSLSNYLWLTSGSNDGFTTDVCPDTVSADNIVRHFASAHISWHEYAENLGKQGNLGCGGDGSGRYAGRHNPFIYYTDVTGNATEAANIRDFSTFATDVAAGSVARYNFITPNICDDGHDLCAPASNRFVQIDNWLKTHVAALLNANIFQTGGDGTLVIVFDEGTTSTNGGGQVVWVTVGPNVKAGSRSAVFHQHQATLRQLMEMVGATSFPQGAATTSDMAGFYNY